MASNLHDWLKSYGDFAAWVDYAYWWSCIGKVLRAACKAIFFLKTFVFSEKFINIKYKKAKRGIYQKHGASNGRVCYGAIPSSSIL